MKKLKYYPGCLLHEYCIGRNNKVPILQGVFLIIGMDPFDVTTVSVYDKDGYYKPPSTMVISREYLHNRRKSFQWVIQEP